mmetsp:Transcript_31809/g.67379  ORF Transcript_31809/g.67379 Transcript_31809/m.67379 type:complete len:162 (+) Transcript_31809:586-1071(+)
MLLCRPKQGQRFDCRDRPRKIMLPPAPALTYLMPNSRGSIGHGVSTPQSPLLPSWTYAPVSTKLAATRRLSTSLNGKLYGGQYFSKKFGVFSLVQIATLYYDQSSPVPHSSYLHGNVGVAAPLWREGYDDTCTCCAEKNLTSRQHLSARKQILVQSSRKWM